MNFWDEIKILKINLIYLRNAYSWMFKFLQFLFYTNVQWIWANNSRRFFFPLARTATRLLIQRVSVLNCPSIQVWILTNVCIFVSVHPKGRVSRWSSSGGVENGGKRNRCNRDFRPFAKTLKLFFSLSLSLFLSLHSRSGKFKKSINRSCRFFRRSNSNKWKRAKLWEERERERDLEINIKQGGPPETPVSTTSDLD